MDDQTVEILGHRRRPAPRRRRHRPEDRQLGPGEDEGPVRPGLLAATPGSSAGCSLKAEQVKINLCNEKQRQDFFLEFPTPEIDEINYPLSLAEFERILTPLLDRAMVEVDVALASAGNGTT